MIKKIGLVLISASVCLSPLIVSASVIEDLQAQIQSLLAQIKILQQQQINNTSSFSPAACTADVKQCPDGSYVGRTGPKCEFVSCEVTIATATCPHIIRSLSRGSRGDDVSSLQAYLGVSPTGYFGPLTASAVAKFQAGEGLSQVGVVGPLTRGALTRRCTAPLFSSFSTSTTDQPTASATDELFTAFPSSGHAPLTVTFSYDNKKYVSYSGSTSGAIDFGDGQTQSNVELLPGCDASRTDGSCSFPIASHAYMTPGTYRATVTGCKPGVDLLCVSTKLGSATVIVQ